METTINTRLLPAYKTEAAWALVETIPKAGEILYTSGGNNAGRYKIGDGTNTWSNLKYVSPLFLYGVCSTAAATKAKAVTISNFSSLVNGTTIQVRFENSNTAENPTLNVNSTGAKTIYNYGSSEVGTLQETTWENNAIIDLTYDSTLNGWIRVNYTNSVNAMHGFVFATQSNSSASASVTATASNYRLRTGAVLMLRVSYDIPANATLNVAGTGAKNIYFRGNPITAGVLLAGDRCTLQYTGSTYTLMCNDRQTDIQSIVTQVLNQLPAAESNSF